MSDHVNTPCPLIFQVPSSREDMLGGIFDTRGVGVGVLSIRQELLILFTIYMTLIQAHISSLSPQYHMSQGPH